ncbi:MAG: SDR family NAD(P)-dependent oxidoreductase [Myxococcota bacterium]
MSPIRFDGRVAIVTGAGNGLGKSHALELARRGAKVVVNDLGGGVDGTGASSEAAEKVVAEIEGAGGEALAHGASVTDADQVQDMVDQTIAKWGRVDILVNNAGILRDKSFAKMSLEDFRLVVDVHLMGSVTCTKAVWPIMREQSYGRVAMTTSSSGLYGNFGQSNYGAAKMALVGFMNTLVIEGAKNDIRINTLSPVAATRMTENLPGMAEILPLLKPEAVTAGLIYLVAEDAPNRLILCAGAGGFAASRIYETDGIFVPEDDRSPEAVASRIEEIMGSEGQQILSEGAGQTMKFLQKAMADKS